MRGADFFKRVPLLLCAAAVIVGGADRGDAQPAADGKTPATQQVQSSGQKSAHERRKEAKKRLQEALEARKAQRQLDRSAVPEREKGGTR